MTPKEEVELRELYPFKNRTLARVTATLTQQSELLKRRLDDINHDIKLLEQNLQQCAVKSLGKTIKMKINDYEFLVWDRPESRDNPNKFSPEYRLYFQHVDFHGAGVFKPLIECNAEIRLRMADFLIDFVNRVAIEIAGDK